MRFEKYMDRPELLKRMINLYPPYVGAGIKVSLLDLDRGYVRVEMPLTRMNQNIVGTQFGGSLYSMVDPFFMLILIKQLGDAYRVWDKNAAIDFIKPGRSRVHAEIILPAGEAELIRQLAANNEPVLRVYPVDIRDEENNLIAHVEKTLYIRLRPPEA